MTSLQDPASTRWRELLDTDQPILADGAMGTMLFANGLEFGDPPEVWNIAHPDIIRRVHRGYLDAGSRILLTNTFGGNRFRLEMHGNASRVDELNRTAAILLRSEVDAAGTGALVAGDIGPSGQIMAPLGTLDYDEAVDGFAEQARALVAGGVDVLWIETMSALEEIHAAIDGARRVAPSTPIIATMTFDTRGRTMMGVHPEQAAEALLGWGADAIGGNCGNGPDELVPVVQKMHAVAPGAVIVAKSNAGIPELVDMKTVYRAGPDEMATRAIEIPRGGRTDHRRLLRQHAGSSRADASGPAGGLTRRALSPSGSATRRRSPGAPPTPRGAAAATSRRPPGSPDRCAARPPTPRLAAPARHRRVVLAAGSPGRRSRR